MSAADLDALRCLWRGIAAALPSLDRPQRLLTICRAMAAQGAGAEGSPVALRVYMDGAALWRLLEALAELRGAMPGASLASVIRGAVRGGLKRLCAPEGAYRAGDFAPRTCPTPHSIEVELEPADAMRVACLAVAFDVDAALVTSAALCTGAAMLAGVDERIAGPCPQAAEPLGHRTG